MGRTAIWTSIREALETEIGDGRYQAGDKLPTEAA
jgi:DNA-binding GntR family transcriptional regulator